MIVIQIQLSNVSIFSLFGCLLSVPPAVLGLILGTHSYSSIRHLQIPSCLLAAAQICVALSQFIGVLSPYKCLQIMINAATTVLLAASGMYYICERLSYGINQNAYTNIPMERALVCLWLISLLVSISITAFSIGPAWLATFGSEQITEAASKSQEEGIFYQPEADTKLSNFLKFTKPGARRSIPSLDVPVNIPIVPETHSPLSPQASWPSTLGSLQNNASLGSLRSALDINTGSIDGYPAQQPHLLTHKDSMATQGTKLQNNTPSPGKTSHPKSPLKIHLSRSSFSLKRSPSKASHPQQNPRRSVIENKRPLNASSHSPSEPSALGIPSGVPMTPDYGGQHGWVMIPNENIAESRSVSGSSQLTGNVFPAAEYNRKINSAGFQRDEPIPVNIKMVPSLESLSQYDLERMQKLHRQEQR